MNSFSMTRSSQYAANVASPGVSLERGNYRMRAPNIRPLPPLLQGHGLPIRRSPQQRVNTQLVFLLILLAAACITCFGSAYYLFVTRWDTRPVSSPFIANSPNEAIVSEEPAYPLVHPEKYLSYLPHSGFHNQRIAFENALILAYVLRRTLLVPPIRLGNRPIRYVEYDTLSQYLDLSGKAGLSHCPKIPPHISRPSECLQYFESSFIPWTWLVDLSALLAHQSLYHLPNSSRTWIRAHFNIAPSDIYSLRDESPYQFRFFDNVSDSSPPQDRYQEDIYITELTTVKEKLLQIGTLFGTSRLRLTNPANLAYRTGIRRNMIFVNKDLTGAADSIARSLENYYIGVHLRSGDGLFKSKIEDTVNSTLWKVLRDVLGLSVSAICELETIFDAKAFTSCALEMAGTNATMENSPTPTPPPMYLPFPPALGINCRAARHVERRYQSLNNPLYVATDLSTPETNPLLSIFRQIFPCIFFLGDFVTEIAALEQLKSPYDEVDIQQFVLPFVDALVVGKALRVVGTEGSTFSRFVEDILWSSSHDRDNQSQ
ncbi:hypothetical protein BDZ97DRAFT_1779938 [Flammula alnicola]|nr:hypothetical protein BDZ97DRAFT_1779938 [Flammula alnicola]